jgi:hypothetical protein
MPCGPKGKDGAKTPRPPFERRTGDAWFKDEGTAPALAEAALWTRLLNQWLGTDYRVDEVLDMDDEYLDQLRITMRLAERASKWWGKG